MISRKITVVSSKTQKKSVIMSSATTLGELKDDLRQNGISYDGMTFYEGTSKTELKVDDAILPHDVPYKGNVTNELVFMLSTTDKKIRSGANDRRTAAYAGIKKHNLQGAVQKKFGKNFTMCKTEFLEEMIAEAEKSSKPKAPVAGGKKTAPKATPAPKKAEKKEEPKAKEAPSSEPVEVVDNVARAAISKLVDILSEKNCYDGEPTIESDDAKAVLDILGGAVEAPSQAYKPSSASSYSDDDIDDMFKEMVK